MGSMTKVKHYNWLIDKCRNILDMLDKNLGPFCWTVMHNLKKK